MSQRRPVTLGLHLREGAQWLAGPAPNTDLSGRTQTNHRWPPEAYPSLQPHPLNWRVGARWQRQPLTQDQPGATGTAPVPSSLALATVHVAGGVGELLNTGP